MNLINLLANDNYIIVNKTLAKILGVEGALLLGELCSEYCYWEKQGELKDGYFFSTIENVKENTTILEHKQRALLKTMKNIGLVDVILKGLPAKRYIKINEQVLSELLNNSIETIGTSSAKTKELEQPISSTNNNKEIIINKNNNKERKKETSYDVIINEMVIDNQIKELLYEFIKMRKMKKKPLTDRALKILINKLFSLSDDLEEQKQIIEQSLVRSWESFYPVRKENNNDQHERNTSTDYSEFDR